MKYIMLLVVLLIFYSIFDWIIVKTDIHNKLFNKPRIKKHIKSILIIVFIVFVFFIEYIRISLKDIYGYGSYLNMIASAFLGSLYINFIPLIFKKDKK